MSATFTEHSESDATTTYPLVLTVYDGTTATGTKVFIADSSAYGRLLFLDGQLQSASADEHIYHESLVHPAMACAKTPNRVLVVGGGEGATVREVLRWPQVTHVDWVDYDNDLVNLCKTHLNWAPELESCDETRVHYQAKDIHVALSDGTLLLEYDVILLDLPDPDEETADLYTPAFWTDIKRRVAPDGRLATHCGPVKPYGNVGGGFQRVRKELGPSGFYRIGIPSFQGDWGFWLWSPTAAAPFEMSTVFPELRVVDTAQMNEWRTGSRLWTAACV